jgi:hypothetical protein
MGSYVELIFINRDETLYMFNSIRIHDVKSKVKINE